MKHSFSTDLGGFVGFVTLTFIASTVVLPTSVMFVTWLVSLSALYFVYQAMFGDKPS